MPLRFFSLFFCTLSPPALHADIPPTAAPARQAIVLTPAPAATPHFNNPSVFGVRPGNPFSYSISCTGDRPMTFSVVNLPTGLRLDPETGRPGALVAYSFIHDGKTFTPFGGGYQARPAGYRGDQVGICTFNATAEAGFVDVDSFIYEIKNR